MGQNKQGARKATKTKRNKYGKNIFREWGLKGGNPMLLRGKK